MHSTPTPYSREPEAGSATSREHQLRRVETLTGELKQLLERNNSVFDDEIIHRQISLLEHWMDCYHRGLVTADTFSGASVALVSDLQTRLKLAEEEIQRLEDEGGATANKEQIEENEALLQAIRRSEKLITSIETLFPNSHH